MERVDKETKKRVMEVVQKVNSEDYETSWDEKGAFVSKKKSKVKEGRLSRAQGARFELKVRENLEKEGWTVSKWPNNVDLEIKKLVPAKRKYNPFRKMLIVGTGFPDFIVFRLKGENTENQDYDVRGIEVKMNGTLSKIEKEKCHWLISNKVFSKILVAKKGEKRGQIEYVEFSYKNNKKS